ncbi:MAG: lysoplasmalogenase [Jatrophihabitantaceae bacterium]
MTPTLLALTALIAVGDWVAVAQRRFRLEYLLKPLTLGLLILAAVGADLGAARPWVIAALGFGLLGDLALMFGRDDGSPDGPFLLGLGSFLVGHVCYLVGFARHGLHTLNLLAGVLIVGGAAALTLPPVLRGAKRIAGQELMAVVAAYAVMLAAMAALAVGTGSPATAVGGLLFLGSDIAIAHQRFVRSIPRGPLVVIVTYHLAQLLIVIGLIHHG